MMVITRLYPENASVDLWNPIVSGLLKCEIKGITPLYVSQRDDRGFTSIISEAESPDAVMEMLECDVLKKQRIRRGITITLAKEVFFPTTLSGGRLRRYHFSIRATPMEIRNIHMALRKAKPTPDAGLAYLACAFGEADLIGSMVAVDYDRAKDLLVKNVGNLANLIAFNISRVARSKRLVDDANWKKIVAKYSHMAQDEKIPGMRELDWTLVEETLITGGFRSEVEEGG